MTTAILSAAFCARLFTAPAGSRVFSATSRVSIELTASFTICMRTRRSWVMQQSRLDCAGEVGQDDDAEGLSSYLALDRDVVLLSAPQISPQPQCGAFPELKPRAVILVKICQVLDPP